MSKIGRMPINCTDVKVDIKGNDVHFAGKFLTGTYTVPAPLTVELKEDKLFVKSADMSRKAKCLWGLHRALLASRIGGSQKPFERQVQIIGLGFKAIPKGTTVEFSLGYSHKINFELPKGVSIEVDKTGQNITLKSSDKELLGQVCGQFRLLRPVEPYKGTGIKVDTDVVIRKAGKTKAGS